MMPDHRLSGWLAAGGLLALAMATCLSASAFADDRGGSPPSVLPILAWLVMPLLLGAASLVGAVCIEVLWREVRRPPSLEAQAPEE